MERQQKQQKQMLYLFCPICAVYKMLYVQVYISVTIFCRLSWKTSNCGFLWGEAGQWWQEIWLFFLCTFWACLTWFGFFKPSARRGSPSLPVCFEEACSNPAAPSGPHAASPQHRNSPRRWLPLTLGTTHEATTSFHLYGVLLPSSVPDRALSFLRANTGLVSC